MRQDEAALGVEALEDALIISIVQLHEYLLVAVWALSVRYAEPLDCFFHLFLVLVIMNGCQMFMRHVSTRDLEGCGVTAGNHPPC